MKTTETGLKQGFKDLLAVYGIFNFPILQGIGAYKGIPDRIVHVNGKVHYIEFKKVKGKLSEHQLAFKAQCEADGIDYHVIRSLDEAIELVNAWREQ
jgi:hypothetical protein